MNKYQEKIRDELAEVLNQGNSKIYEWWMTDIPRGPFKEGYNACYQEMKPLVEALKYYEVIGFSRDMIQFATDGGKIATSVLKKLNGTNEVADD